jgi:hypothetical protein
VAKIGESLAAMNKQISHRFHTERINLKKLNGVEGKEQYRVEVLNSFAALEHFDADVDTNSAWKTIKENIKILAKRVLVIIK